MTNLKKRERAKTNASLISMVQRFSDITIMFAGLWLVCEVSGLSFLYMHLLVALITLVVFQMLGGITDFYRSWRGVRAATEFALLQVTRPVVRNAARFRVVVNAHHFKP